MSSNRMEGWKKGNLWVCEPENLHTIRREVNLRWGDLRGIEELAESIARQGQIHPGLVRVDSGGETVLVAGFRRLAAIELINSDLARFKVPEPLPFKATRANLTEDQALEANLCENDDRSELSPVDRAFAAQRLERFGWPHERIAMVLKYKSASRVAQLLKLLSLPHETLLLVHSGELTEAGARAMLGAPVEQVREASRTISSGEVKPREAVELIKTTKREAGAKVGRTLAELKRVLEDEIGTNRALLLLAWINGDPRVATADLGTIFDDDAPATVAV